VDIEELVKNSINSRLNNVRKLSSDCRLDAEKASNRKRRSRWINGIFGGLTAILGITITTVSDPNTQKILGLMSAICGSIVATAGQYIDPVKSRQRAVDLQTLRIELDKLAHESQVKFVGLEASPSELSQLIELDKDFMNKLSELEKQALERGVGV